MTHLISGSNYQRELTTLQHIMYTPHWYRSVPCIMTRDLFKHARSEEEELGSSTFSVLHLYFALNLDSRAHFSVLLLSNLLIVITD